MDRDVLTWTTSNKGNGAFRCGSASEIITSSCVYESTETVQSFGDDTRAVAAQSEEAWEHGLRTKCGPLRQWTESLFHRLTLQKRTRTNADVRPGLSCNVQTSRKTDKDIRKRETQRRRDTETERDAQRDTYRERRIETRRDTWTHGETHGETQRDRDTERHRRDREGQRDGRTEGRRGKDRREDGEGRREGMRGEEEKEGRRERNSWWWIPPAQLERQRINEQLETTVIVTTIRTSTIAERRQKNIWLRSCWSLSTISTPSTHEPPCVLISHAEAVMSGQESLRGWIVAPASLVLIWDFHIILKDTTSHRLPSADVTPVNLPWNAGYLPWWLETHIFFSRYGDDDGRARVCWWVLDENFAAKAVEFICFVVGWHRTRCCVTDQRVRHRRMNAVNVKNTLQLRQILNIHMLTTSLDTLILTRWIVLTTKNMCHISNFDSSRDRYDLSHFVSWIRKPQFVFHSVFVSFWHGSISNLIHGSRPTLIIDEFHDVYTMCPEPNPFSLSFQLQTFFWLFL